MSAKKQRLGQHFLIDGEVCSRIVDEARINPEEHVLEIGPGRGALTVLLAKNTGRLTLIEPDTKLAPILKKRFPPAEIICGRAERVDFGSLPCPLVVVSNLPYYASVHIFKHCVKHIDSISRMILTFQKEVAQRISAEPGSRSYGSLSLMSRYYWKIREVLAIPPSAFRPPPKVESAVLHFTPHKTPPVAVDPGKLFSLTRVSFTHKRRTLKNNLKKIYSETSIESAFAETGLEEKVRAEAVSLEEFAAMAELLQKMAEPLPS